MWTQEMFGVEKPIIALLHLDALPGDPGYCGSMDTVLEHARQDLVALQNGGVDGILFANEFSLPYQPVADVAVISAMAYIIGALRPLIRVPYGVNVVKNPIATIDLAAASPAQDLPGAASRVHTWENMAFIPPTAVRQSATARRWRSRI